jgi:hypothetical protein
MSTGFIVKLLVLFVTVGGGTFSSMRGFLV